MGCVSQGMLGRFLPERHFKKEAYTNFSKKKLKFLKFLDQFKALGVKNSHH
jgi:hypothetical protein